MSRVMVSAVYVCSLTAWVPTAAAASTISSARSRERLWLPDISATTKGGWLLPMGRPAMSMLLDQPPGSANRMSCILSLRESHSSFSMPSKTTSSKTGLEIMLAQAPLLHETELPMQLCHLVVEDEDFTRKPTQLECVEGEVESQELHSRARAPGNVTFSQIEAPACTLVDHIYVRETDHPDGA